VALPHRRAQTPTSVDARREAGPVAEHSTEDPADLLACYRAFHTPSQQAAAREELERVEAAFDRLPPDHRQVIVMAKILGLSHAEIGAELGRSSWR